MKYLFFLNLIFLFCSCSKDIKEEAIIEIDSKGNVVTGDTNIGKFTIWNVDTNNSFNKTFFKENTIGFLPYKQNCNDYIKLSMYPNPVSGTDTLKYKIISNRNMISVWYWPNNGSSMYGYNCAIPTKFINEEYGGLLVNGERTDNQPNTYNFMVVTEDSCVYITSFKIVRK